jgi:prepilin-type N-terminal cleavage/methylation domain-containing protein
MKNKKMSKNGFSLIELLVSIALLTIMAIGFMPLLTSSYTGIFSSGDKNKVIDQAQKEIEQLFYTGSDEEEELSVVFIDVDTIEFKIPGEYINIEKTYGDGKSVTFDVFIPKR